MAGTVETSFTIQLDAFNNVRPAGSPYYGTEVDSSLTLELDVSVVTTDYPEIIFLDRPFISGVATYAIEDTRRVPALAITRAEFPVDSAVAAPWAEGELCFYRPEGAEEIQLFVCIDVREFGSPNADLQWVPVNLSATGHTNSRTGGYWKGRRGNFVGELY